MTEIVCSAEGVSCSVVVARPRWSDVYRGYPKTSSGLDLPAPEVFQSILRPASYNPSLFNNACATRVSLGLIEGGVRVSPNFQINLPGHVYEGRGFIASARGLAKWLSKDDVFGEADIFLKGPADIDKLIKEIDGRNGIYIILGGFGRGISGHATLWIGEDEDVIGGNNYLSHGGDVHFWELRD